MAKLKDLTTIPAPRDFATFPEFARLSSRLKDLRSRLALAEQEMASVVTKLRGRRFGEDAVAKAASDILYCEQLPAGALVGSPVDRAALGTRRDHLEQEQRVLREAISRGEVELAALKRKFAAEACAELRAWHGRLTRAMAESVAELVRLAKLEARAFDDLDAAGVPFSGMSPRGATRPVVLVGDASEGANSAAAIYLQELISQGHIDAGEAWLAGSGAGSIDAANRDRVARARQTSDPYHAA